MKIEEQVVSLELAKRLRELGVKQESLCWWQAWTSLERGDWYELETWQLIRRDDSPDNYSAFTVAELGEILNYRQPARDPEGWWVLWDSTIHSGPYKTEADGRAALLIYLIENGMVKP